MKFEELTPGMRIIGKYSSSIRTIELFDDEYVKVSHFDKRGNKEFDYIETRYILAYWKPFTGRRTYKWMD